MRSRYRAMSMAIAGAATLATSACATAQMHTDEQLNSVAQGCGLSLGEIMQDESEKRLLFLMRSEPTAEQRTCVYAWAHRNHLRLVILKIVTEPQT
jgi:hypothetical protein